MADEQELNPKAKQPTVYQIKIKGYLSQQRMDWFEGLTVTLEADGNTLISGSLADQSALHGVLKKIRDLGMPLLSINSRIYIQGSATQAPFDETGKPEGQP